MTKPAQTAIRVLYTRISDADVKKLIAQSNKTQSGGGARDIRFSDYDFLLPFIKKFFPNIEKKKSKSFLTGDLYWVDDQTGATLNKKAEFWGPTNSRPNEGRLSKVHNLKCFDPSRMVAPQSEGGSILMLLIQQSDLSVWPYYVSENSLRHNKSWDQTVAKSILACLDKENSGTGRVKTTQGYVDLTNKTRYCNHDK